MTDTYLVYIVPLAEEFVPDGMELIDAVMTGTAEVVERVVLLISSPAETVYVICA